LAENSPPCPRITISLKPSSQQAATEVIDLVTKTDDPQVVEIDIPGKVVDHVKNKSDGAKRDPQKVDGQINPKVVDEFVCDVCLEYFTIYWQLDDHRRNEHGIGLTFKSCVFFLNLLLLDFIFLCFPVKPM
jgi:hypothetical protein